MTLSLAHWSASGHFERYLADMLGDELGRMRHVGRVRLGRDWRLAPSVAPVDSLEIVRLATAVASLLPLSFAGRQERLQDCGGLPEWSAEIRRCLPGGVPRLGFRTSGSSGARKVVFHDAAFLEREIEALASLFAGRKRIVTLAPAHHIYGFLFTVLLPLRLGVEVIDLRGSAPPTARDLLSPGDLVVAFPDYWRLLAEGALPANVVGSTSGAPCPADVFRATRAAGLKRLVEIYGSTETSGVGWRDDPDAPFTLFPHWMQAPDGGVSTDVVGQRIVFELPDEVEWIGNAALRPLRRRDGAVQVGGVNVFPNIVRSVLRAHPAVADAAVRLMRPEEGDRLKAFIALADPEADEDSLRGVLSVWATERLQPMEQPRSYVFGREIPKTEMGKTADWTILPRD